MTAFLCEPKNLFTVCFFSTHFDIKHLHFVYDCQTHTKKCFDGFTLNNNECSTQFIFKLKGNFHKGNLSKVDKIL